MQKQVLVVDDQFGIRVLLQEVLEREGYEVLLAGSGMEALQIVGKHEPDLVLL
ncbi:MAG: response regulator, partial [Firmicutes bacterium]|nr:response regulator [Bacillota bacterium]